MKQLLIVVMALALSFQAFSTEKPLSGDWIQHRIEPLDGTSVTKADYFRLKFVGDKVFIIQGDHQKLLLPYSFDGKTFKSLVSYEVEEYTKDRLVLVEKNKAKYYFISQKKYASEAHLSYKMQGSEKVYQYDPGIAPIYNQNESKLLLNYFDGLTGSISFTYIIDKNGKPGSVKILSATDRSLKHKLIRCIESMPGQWIPGNVNGEPVSVELERTLYFANQRGPSRYQQEL